jgi:hypothetical protein
MARDRTGLDLVLKDGRHVSIADSGFEEEVLEILQALEGRGVKLATSLKTRLKKMREAETKELEA